MLDSRLVQSALAVGAAGPVGLLAVPGIRDSRERRRLQNEELDERVAARRRQREATDRLQGLLEERRTVTGPGTDIFGIEGDVIAETPGRRADVPAISTQGGQLEAMGLLADVSPVIGAQGLLGAIQPQQQRSEPAELRLIRALNDPSLDDGQKELLRQSISQKGGGELLGAIELQRAQIELQQAKLDLGEKANSQTDLRTQRRNTVRRQSKNILNLAAKADNLEGEFLQPGAPGLEGRQIVAGAGRFAGDLFGFDTPDLDKQFTTLGELRKGLADLSIDMQSRFEGTFTNDKLALLQRAMATTENDPATIRTILRQMAELYIEKADQFDISLDNRKELESFINPPKAQRATAREPSEPRASSLRDLSDDDLMRQLTESL